MANIAVKENLYDVIRSPLVTEKSTFGVEYSKYTFKVSQQATKDQVKKAVELAFGVKVEKVNTIYVKGKTKRFRGQEGKRPSYKKAVVTLVEGQTIDVTAGV